jgi:hypothetical protein
MCVAFRPPNFVTYQIRYDIWREPRRLPRLWNAEWVYDQNVTPNLRIDLDYQSDCKKGH